MTIKDACSAFTSRCTALNLTDGTLAWYAHILRDLTGFLATKGILELSAIEPMHLRDFLAYLRQRGQSSQTVSRTFGAVRCVFRFLHREGILSRNSMELVDRPRKERHLIRPLSVEQAMQLIEQPDTTTFEGLRDRAMIMLMMDSGLRVSEVISLEGNRIDWMSCTLTVMGKGRKERSVPFSAKTCQALLEYSRLRAQKGVRVPQFFTGRTSQALERTKVRRIILHYGNRAKIEGVRISPHTLRHTFAVFYVRNGGDSFSLQEILGHSTLEMTKNYVHLARRDISDQHKKFSPMESLFGREIRDINHIPRQSVAVTEEKRGGLLQ
jgi:site-specific recombinase XerD